jgi:hypothetical protein
LIDGEIRLIRRATKLPHNRLKYRAIIPGHHGRFVVKSTIFVVFRRSGTLPQRLNSLAARRAVVPPNPFAESLLPDTVSPCGGLARGVESGRRAIAVRHNRALGSRRHTERPRFLEFDATALFACQPRVAGEQFGERAVFGEFGEMAGDGTHLSYIFGLARPG